jgi:hypothetical protein
MAQHDKIQRMIMLLKFPDFLAPMQIQLLNTLLAKSKAFEREAIRNSRMVVSSRDESNNWR